MRGQPKLQETSEGREEDDHVCEITELRMLCALGVRSEGRGFAAGGERELRCFEVEWSSRGRKGHAAHAGPFHIRHTSDNHSSLRHIKRHISVQKPVF